MQTKQLSTLRRLGGREYIDLTCSDARHAPYQFIDVNPVHVCVLMSSYCAGTSQYGMVKYSTRKPQINGHALKSLLVQIFCIVCAEFD